MLSFVAHAIRQQRLAIVVLALVLTGSTASLGAAKKGTRTATLNYTAVPGPCPAPDTDGTDCVVFGVRSEELYVRFELQDSSGLTPGAIPWRDADGDGQPEVVDETDRFCQRSDDPYFIGGAKNVGLYIDSVDCIPSAGIRGSIEATFSKRAR